jgi:GT2 family glycosyltransferase
VVPVRESAVSIWERAHVSAVIPTYGREQVLLDTLDHLLRMSAAASEILVVDQTPRHAAETHNQLRTLNALGKIVWVQLDQPSIPRAMNTGLVKAREEIVLFLDDDVAPDEGLILAHARAHEEPGVAVVAGRIVQPWESGRFAEEPGLFRFSSMSRQWVPGFMGGNFSVKRSAALAIGGFDENFVHVAYRFEADFADRLVAVGGRILFEPAASLRHLKASDGGTRMYGDHLRTVRPSHAVGEYYYILRRFRARAWLRPLLERAISAVSTRHHLRHPWWIPVTMMAEALGFLWALGLALRGPRYLKQV